MPRKLQHIASLLALIGANAVGCAHHPHHGPHHRGMHGEGLTVVGAGEATAAPDLARSSVGIEVRDESAEQATARANEQMAAVIAAIKAAGVSEADLRTHDFSISFERDFMPPQPAAAPATPPAPPTGKGGARAAVTPAAPAPEEPRGMYRVTNTLEVTVRDVSKISQILTAATRAGANNIWGVSFELADREPLHQRAREQAIERAKQSADQLARLTGVKLGRIVTVEDQAAAGPGPVYARALRMEKVADGAVPIEQGELTVTHQVRLVYALDKD